MSGRACTNCCPCHLTLGRRGMYGQMNCPVMDDRGAFGMFWVMAVSRSKAEIFKQLNNLGL